MSDSASRFDPESSWSALDRRLETEPDPRNRDLLRQVRDHIRSEVLGNLEELLDTLIDEPRYHFWGVPVEGGPKGGPDVRSFYEGMFAGGGNRFQFDIRRIFVDHGGVVTEGTMRQTLPGAIVTASGVTEVDGAPVDSEATYLAETQLLTVWPAGDGRRLVGEDIYFGSNPMERLSRLPD